MATKRTAMLVEKTLFNSPTFSDVKIKQIQGGITKEYYGHKAVLCGHSRWFMNAFAGSFKEAQQNVIDIHDDNPHHFDIMLMYLYTHEYELPSDISDFEKQFLIPIGVHALADKYEVTGLAGHAAKAFGDSCAHWPCDCKALGAEQSRQMVEAHYQHCAQVDSLMGKAISDYIIRVTNSFMHSDVFVTLIHEYPVLGADIFLALKRNLCLGKCKGTRGGW